MNKNSIKNENNNEFEKELDLNKPFSMMKSINAVDVVIKEMFTEINVWENPSEILSKKIADNHKMQMKLENTLIGKKWPALLENAKFLRVMNKLESKKEFLSKIAKILNKTKWSGIIVLGGG